MKIFVVVDMQNDFVTGSLGSPEAQALVPRIEAALYNLDEETDVVFTRDTHAFDYLKTAEGQKLPVEHCIEGTPGWQIVDTIDVVRCHDTINKPTFGSTTLINLIGAYLGDNLAKDLEVELCGVCTDICVVSNALILKAFYPEAKIKVLADLCAGSSPMAHEAALATMRSCQIDIL